MVVDDCENPREVRPLHVRPLHDSCAQVGSVIAHSIKLTAAKGDAPVVAPITNSTLSRHRNGPQADLRISFRVQIFKHFSIVALSVLAALGWSCGTSTRSYIPDGGGPLPNGPFCSMFQSAQFVEFTGSMRISLCRWDVPDGTPCPGMIPSRCLSISRAIPELAELERTTHLPKICSWDSGNARDFVCAIHGQANDCGQGTFCENFSTEGGVRTSCVPYPCP